MLGCRKNKFEADSIVFNFENLKSQLKLESNGYPQKSMKLLSTI